jgi:hypothetical protein
LGKSLKTFALCCLQHLHQLSIPLYIRTCTRNRASPNSRQQAGATFLNYFFSHLAISIFCTIWDIFPVMSFFLCMSLYIDSIERLDQGHLYPLGESRDKHVTGGARTSALLHRRRPLYLKSYPDSLYTGYSEPLLGLTPHPLHGRPSACAVRVGCTWTQVVRMRIIIAIVGSYAFNPK